LRGQSADFLGENGGQGWIEPPTRGFSERGWLLPFTSQAVLFAAAGHDAHSVVQQGHRTSA
jgi:hypothetical protein